MKRLILLIVMCTPMPIQSLTNKFMSNFQFTLKIAIQENNLEMLNNVLNENSAIIKTITALDSNENTPLHYAIHHVNKRAFVRLLHHYDHLINIYNTSEQTPLDKALEMYEIYTKRNQQLIYTEEEQKEITDILDILKKIISSLHALNGKTYKELSNDPKTTEDSLQILNNKFKNEDYLKKENIKNNKVKIDQKKIPSIFTYITNQNLQQFLKTIYNPNLPFFSEMLNPSTLETPLQAIANCYNQEKIKHEMLISQKQDISIDQKYAEINKHLNNIQTYRLMAQYLLEIRANPDLQDSIPMIPSARKIAPDLFKSIRK